MFVLTAVLLVGVGAFSGEKALPVVNMEELLAVRSHLDLFNWWFTVLVVVFEGILRASAMVAVVSAGVLLVEGVRKLDLAGKRVVGRMPR